MRNRMIWLVGIAALLIGVVVAAWVVTLRVRPDAATLLELLPPGAELYGVADLEGLQSNPAIRKLLSDSHGNPETEYARFLRDSGFRYQDDLKQVAVAKLGPDWVGVARVAVERARIVSYMQSEGAGAFQLEGLTGYAFGTERPFRLVFLDDQSVAFSVGGEPEPLRQVVGRARNAPADSAAAELRGSADPQSLPGDSELWVYGRLDRFLERETDAARLGQFQLGKGEWLDGSRTAHLRVESSPIQLEVQIEDRCDSTAAAERIANWAKALLVILKAAPSPQIQSSGPDYTPLLRAISVRQESESVFIEWRWDASMLALLNPGSP